VYDAQERWKGSSVAKSLVIVESPAKASTIKKYLGADFEVEASVGHVKDLPQKKLGVDVEAGFVPQFVVVQGKKKVLEHLKKLAASVDHVYLAPDPDREGEAIAWHIAEELKDVAPHIDRVLFHEITKTAVQKALTEPRKLDQNMVESQLSRRILDRLVGYQISPILWRKVQKGLSAGRVQSVAVRLVVDREREIEAFVPVEYWMIGAVVSRATDNPPQPFKVALRRVDKKKAEIGSAEQAKALLDRVRSAEFRVAAVERKERRRSSPPPYITSSLQQDASRLLRFSPSHTMALAQRLYEGIEIGDEGRVGLITYMRTDSVRISDEAVAAAREVIKQRFGPEYVPARAIVFKNKKSAQDAHEAVRPSSAERLPADLKSYLGRDEFKLYSLIYTRFMACQMAPAIYDQTVVDVAAGDVEFRANGSVLRFDGFLKAWRVEREGRVVHEERAEPAPEGDDDEAGDGTLPAGLTEGDLLALRNLLSEQKFTEPCARFSEATLVKELEDRGIGRPSTYATIVSTIQGKGYVNKEEGKLRPTELGRIVTDLLVQHFADIMDFAFTARMEEGLDDVEEGRKDRISLLSSFYVPFDAALKAATVEMRSVKSEASPSGIACELCGKEMLVRFGRNGMFLGCSGYPECHNTREFKRGERGEIVSAPPEDLGKCPKCAHALLLRQGRFGKFIACSGYPECDFKKPFVRAEHCPVPGCPGLLVEKKSQKGRRFFSCSEYPKCRFITSLEPMIEICPSCAAPTLFLKSFRGMRSISCLREGCKYTKQLPKTVKSADLSTETE